MINSGAGLDLTKFFSFFLFFLSPFNFQGFHQHLDMFSPKGGLCYGGEGDKKWISDLAVWGIIWIDALSGRGLSLTVGVACPSVGVACHPPHSHYRSSCVITRRTVRRRPRTVQGFDWRGEAGVVFVGLFSYDIISNVMKGSGEKCGTSFSTY
uniref:Uncharacterized protein n=1 Tax=Anguilla anguilla TaxID=7936 RepID=A0A0E9WZZ6_ANGAN